VLIICREGDCRIHPDANCSILCVDQEDFVVFILVECFRDLVTLRYVEGQELGTFEPSILTDIRLSGAFLASRC
jgi:hypothetical protein